MKLKPELAQKRKLWRKAIMNFLSTHGNGRKMRMMMMIKVHLVKDGKLALKIMKNFYIKKSFYIDFQKYFDFYEIIF